MITIEKHAISNQVLSYLRKEIMLKRLKAGHHLKEIELSEQLNVSRGPIREAFTILANESLVEKRLNGRTIVREFTKQDIEDLYNTRILLENAALAEIKFDVFQENIKNFNFYISRMKESEDKSSADIAFHELIMELSGNKALKQLWISLNGIVFTLMEITNEYLRSRHQEAIQEHLVIIDNMEKGNVKGAQEALKMHLKGAAIYYVDAVNEITSGRGINNGK